MQIEIGCRALEGPRAVKHGRRKPARVAARAHDPRVALAPLVLEKRPGLRPPNGHATLPRSLPYPVLQRSANDEAARARRRAGSSAWLPCLVAASGSYKPSQNMIPTPLTFS